MLSLVHGVTAVQSTFVYNALLPSSGLMERLSSLGRVKLKLPQGIPALRLLSLAI